MSFTLQHNFYRPTPIGSVALATDPLNLHFFDSNKYVPVSNLHFTIPSLTSDTVDSKDDHTGCTLPMRKKFAFLIFQ